MDLVIINELLDDNDLISSSSSSSSSSSDGIEEFLEIVEHLIVPRPRNTITNYCDEVVPFYSDKEFLTHFRVCRELLSDLTDEFSNSIVYRALILPGNTRASISPEKHMLTFMWFAGHQTASFRDVADRFDLSISSLHAITCRVIEFLSSMAYKIIKWPTLEQKAQTMEHYHRTKGFPNILGSIDGSHIQIDKPSEGGNDYVNRKNFPSMILQGICNEERKFIDVFIGYPGSVHDARVFQNAPITSSLQRLCEGGYLLGDSAYPLLNVLMTPHRDNGHLTAAQKHFNTKLSSCRISIEHTFGILKQRFRQLYHLKLKGHERICHFIRACCVLHNLANEEDLVAFAGEENPHDQQPDHEEVGEEANGDELRDEITRQLFMHR